MTVDYNDAMQILEDPKAAAWELRDLAKSLLEDLQVARAAERERCEKELKAEYLLICSGAKQARAPGDKP